MVLALVWPLRDGVLDGRAAPPPPSATGPTWAPGATLGPARPAAAPAAPALVSLPTVEVATAPLTGRPAEAALLARAALVAKIDAVGPAMPQSGLERADVVVEVAVEGANRYLAVWHSRDVELVGPVRSARTTDSDVVAAFGRPLFAASGANPAVDQVITSTPWLVPVGPGRVGGAFSREAGRRAPHNLYARPGALWATAGGSPPPALLPRHPPGQPPAGRAATSFSVPVGTTARFRWDGALGGWRRTVWGRDHEHAGGGPVAPTNVVVLETAYRPSPADARSPEAVSLGAGRAWVFSNGAVRDGTWTRLDRARPWELRGPGGELLTLEPGPVWVVLAEGAPSIG